jgi:hypothetical protein
MATTATARPVSAAAAHAALRQVLGRQEFQTYTNPAGNGWKNLALTRWLQQLSDAFKRFGEKVSAAWSRFWRHLFPPHAPKPDQGHAFAWLALSGVMRMVLYAILLGALLLLLGLVISRLLLISRKTREAGEPLHASAPDARKRQRQAPSSWEHALDDAERLWRDGQQREALRVLYRACLVLLDTRGVLRYNETRANGEVLRALRRQGRRDLQQPLGIIVRSFDRSWYGSLAIADEEFATVLETSRRFRTVVMEDTHA